MRTCTNCGETKTTKNFYKSVRSECRACFKERMNERARGNKLILVAEAGGQCVRCGYDNGRCLHFHHKDPKTKAFGLGSKPNAPIEKLREEAKKCVLLCPNCHAEFHNGMWVAEENGYPKKLLISGSRFESGATHHTPL